MPQDKDKIGEFGNRISRGASAVSHAVGEAAEATSRTVGPVVDKASKQVAAGADAVAGVARQAARDISDTVAGELRETVEENVKTRKDKFEAFFDSLSAAVEAGTKRLDKDGFHLTASYAEAGARNLESFARRFGDADLNSATTRLEDYLRKRPLLTLGSAALLGFATYQILKESPARKSARRTAGKAGTRS
jgi:hypothetical protein